MSAVLKAQMQTLITAAKHGTPFCENCAEKVGKRSIREDKCLITRKQMNLLSVTVRHQFITHAILHLERNSQK